MFVNLSSRIQSLRDSIYRDLTEATVEIAEHISPVIRFNSLNSVLAQANVGDMLEFDREYYSHYALYLGNGNVMNVCAVKKNTNLIQIETQSAFEVWNGCHVRIRNHDDVARQHFDKEPRPIAEIIRAAESDEHQFLPYEFNFRNCEYYCTKWRYGAGFSTQVANPGRTRPGFVLREVAVNPILPIATSVTRDVVESYVETNAYFCYQQLA